MADKASTNKQSFGTYNIVGVLIEPSVTIRIAVTASTLMLTTPRIGMNAGTSNI